ncbi:ABC transporter permease [Candidatus Woesearchaeota archaeon]|nr:ABC transporter permease [Candidatus Woesearchaeota archaeon]
MINKKTIILKVLSVLFVVIIWQILSSSQIINAHFIPPPLEIAKSFILTIQSTEIFKDIYVSISRVFVGFLMGAVIGLIFGVITSYSAVLRYLLSIWIEFIRPIPPLAWIPLAILWFGLGNKSAIFLVALGSFFPVYSNTFEGVIALPKKFVDTAKTLGADSKLIFLEVVIPAILPYIITGLKIGLGVSWMIVVTAELVGTTSGLGYFIQLNRILLQVDKVIVGMIVIGLIGLVMNYFISLLEKYFSHWKIINTDL